MSCDNNVSKGKELAFLVRADDDTTFELIGGVQSRGITFDNPTEEVTSSSTVTSYSENEYTGFSAVSIDVSGVADNRTGQTDPATGLNIINFGRLVELATSGNRCGYFKILSTDANFDFYCEGFFTISNLALSGSTPGLLEDTATLTSKSDIDVSTTAPVVA